MEIITNLTQLSDLMRNNKIEIINYIKQDGTSRDIHCTLDFNIIPKEKHPKEEKSTPNYLIVVFDLDKNDWRSLVIRKIKRCKVNKDIFVVNIKGI